MTAAAKTKHLQKIKQNNHKRTNSWNEVNERNSIQRTTTLKESGYKNKFHVHEWKAQQQKRVQRDLKKNNNNGEKWGTLWYILSYIRE